MISSVCSEASELKQAVQIIDAQKARLKRELKAFEGRARDATAEKAPAETLVCQMHAAGMADASPEQRGIAMRHEQHTEHLHHQVHKLDHQPETAAEHAQASAEGQENEVGVSGFSKSTVLAHHAHQRVHVRPARCRGPSWSKHSGCHGIKVIMSTSSGFVHTEMS